MNVCLPLLRLWLRPAIFWNVAIMLLASLGILSVGVAISSFAANLVGFDGLPSVASEQYDTVRWTGMLERTVPLIPAEFGNLAGQAISGLLFGTFAWGIPGLRRQLRRSLIITAIVIAALTTVIYKGLGGDGGWVTTFVQAVFWFNVGGVAFYPISGRRLPLLALPTFLISFIFYEAIVAQFAAHPIIWSAVALLVSWYLLNLIVAERSIRIKALTRSDDIGPPGEQYPTEFGNWSLRFPGKVSVRRHWRRAPGTIKLVDWVRAGMYERHGWQRGGWTVRVLFFATMTAIVTLALMFSVGYRDDASATLGFGAVYHGLFHPSPGPVDPEKDGITFTAVIALLLTAGIVTISFDRTPLPASGQCYPLSRRRRAGVAWWVSLLQNGGLVIMIGLLFFAGGQIARHLAGAEGHDNRLPFFVRVLLVCFTIVPVIQYVRITLLSPAFKKRDAVSYFLASIFLGCIMGGLILMICAVWAAVPVDTPVLPQLGAVAAVLVFSQWVLLRSFRRYYTTEDLA